VRELLSNTQKGKKARIDRDCVPHLFIFRWRLGIRDGQAFFIETSLLDVPSLTDVDPV